MVYTAESLRYPEGTTLPQLLLEHNVNDVFADKPAIIDGVSGKTVYTYSTFRTAVRRLANYLRTAIGVRSGSVVAILASNRNDFPVLVHGILAAGGVVSAFNPLHQAPEIAHYLRIARPTIVIAEPSLTTTLTEVLLVANLDYKPDLYLLSSRADHGASWRVFDLYNAINDGSDVPLLPELQKSQSKSNLAFICFSSGTTGPMKGVYLSHDNIVSNIFQHRQRLHGMFGPGNTTVAALITPFFHILGLGVFGITIVVFPKFELPVLLNAIPRDRISHINIVPPIALRLLQSTNERTDFSSVKCLINAAAPLKEVVSSELSRRMGCTITQWYGMTEASPSVISQQDDEVAMTGTVGRLLPGMSMKVIGADGKECESGSSGELLIKGPNIMRGYVGSSAEHSIDTFADGYFKTGDIGYVDEQGYVFLVGRSKELIKVNGNQVAPAELEAILLSHPQVRDAAVRGINFPDQGTEYPAAYVCVGPDVVDQGQLKVDLEALVNSQVVRYKWLRGGVHVVPTIPRK
ncbi:hypothetical protein ASPVEDRAFT_86695 [Aspergillus versicolor CBS 583.65]|uniref:AMP-dependent synthetase/ligase domain-containing protein n=1 Tax=Aspergillus versicolor CBS 583.65 TaxID=1036611 RepID=A0A1L9PUZ5_ASPVE|nr:uncharacterized protein ASPVEDRAFT_86695 [Aspergillus versicolor CBS 583.65]OJJ05341.1 hypothetical protein ASPVEDRAFT_86695 [Aspergillus versicolor CBS 583.65]